MRTLVITILTGTGTTFNTAKLSGCGQSSRVSLQQVWYDALSVVDNFLDTSQATIKEAQQVSNTSTRLLKILGDVGERLSISAIKTFTVSKNKFSIAATQEMAQSFNGISFSYKTNPGKQQLNSVEISKNNTKQGNDNDEVSVYLPPSVSKKFQALENTSLKLVFLVYNEAALFQGSRGSHVNSKVISAEIRNKAIKNLSEPVVLNYKMLKKGNTVCGWWDFSKSGGKGGWSRTGCQLYKSEGQSVVCHCNHLTNFAVLFGADNSKIGSGHAKALSILTYIGCAISLAGTLITFLTYAVFPNLRDRQPPKILMNLCAAYGCLLIVFILGASRTESKSGCQAVAALIQYFLLSVFAWSAVEAFYSHRGLVRPMAAEISKFIWKAMVLAWGLPFIFVAVGMGVWTDRYGDSQSCVVKELPFYVTVVAPVGIILVANITSLVSIMVSLGKSSQMYSHNAMTMRDRLRIISAFVMLFGLTWAFGFLVVSSDVVAFQYIFCILCSLQGFFIFAFYCLRSENVRKVWSEKLHMHIFRDRADTATSVTSKKTQSEDLSRYSQAYTVKTVI